MLLVLRVLPTRITMQRYSDSPVMISCLMPCSVECWIRMDLPDFESVQMLCVVFREFLKPRYLPSHQLITIRGTRGKISC